MAAVRVDDGKLTHFYVIDTSEMAVVESCAATKTGGTCSDASRLGD